MADVEYLSLADFLLIAEAATGVAADELARLPNLALAKSEFIERNGHRWGASDGGPDESVAMIEGIAGGTLSEAQLAV